MPEAQDLDAFLAKYVDPNRAPGSPPFDRSFLLDNVLASLHNIDKGTFGKIKLPIVVAQLCAMKRADLVPAMFLSLHETRTGANQAVVDDFVALRETITIIWPFVGVPNVIPACLGLSRCLETYGVNPPPPHRLETRIPLDDPSFGTEIRRDIYKASANNEVFDMLDSNFGDLAYGLNAVGFGYNIGRVPPSAFNLPEAELILTAALLALGATRQVPYQGVRRVRISNLDVQAIVDTAQKLARWQAGDALSLAIDVREAAREARMTLGMTN